MEPILVVMAAGMGSRYGGMKQIDPVGRSGEIIMDYSIYDARRAGFSRVVFVIKREKEGEFREAIGDRISRVMEVSYAYQDIEDIPAPFSVPEGRMKPWGTGHAVYACRALCDAPFAVINADDFYGAEAFRQIYGFLKSATDDEFFRYAMVGYKLKNTLTENGSVARGVCTVREDQLKGVVERTKILRKDGIIQYTEDGEQWTPLEEESIVSMNFWGFTPSVFGALGSALERFLREEVPQNPIKAELFLPNVMGELLQAKKAVIRMLKSDDRWYGMTYKEDKQTVCEAIRRMTDAGAYPDPLWA